MLSRRSSNRLRHGCILVPATTLTPQGIQSGDDMDRRYFLMASAHAAGTMAILAHAAASDRVRVACVGVRGQGKSHIGAYSRTESLEIAAVCDHDESILNARL